MTAEVAVMNQYGAALAADSAVTVQGGNGPKIFSSADKIFALSKFEPVGIMIYGTASLLNVPWETVIKTYRRSLGDQSFPTLTDYTRDFLAFLETDSPMFPAEQKEFFAYRTALSWCQSIRKEISAAIDDATVDEPISEKEARRITLRTIRERNRDLGQRRDLDDLPADLVKRIDKAYGAEFEEALDDVFGSKTLTKTARRQLREVVILDFTKAFPRASGIVVAGFGTDDVFPQLSRTEVDGLLLDHIVATPWPGSSIDHLNHSSVQGFAQSDMVHLFMEGVTRDYEAFVETYFKEVLEQVADIVVDRLAPDGIDEDAKVDIENDRRALTEHIQDAFRDQRRAIYVQPVLDVVASLPKDELGALAESLVNLTSLKRRISMDGETVGGPVDVAVITRGDGLIWTKRKHYFEPALNHHFFANYFTGQHERTGKN